MISSRRWLCIRTSPAGLTWGLGRFPPQSPRLFFPSQQHQAVVVIEFSAITPFSVMARATRTVPSLTPKRSPFTEFWQLTPNVQTDVPLMTQTVRVPEPSAWLP